MKKDACPIGLYPGAGVLIGWRRSNPATAALAAYPAGDRRPLYLLGESATADWVRRGSAFLLKRE